MSQRHLMIDLETLDTKPSSIVLSIGAVIFTRKTIVETFYSVPDIFPQLLVDRTISTDTVKFWKNQDLLAQDLGKNISSPTLCMAMFNAFIKEHGGDLEKLKVWGKGPHFDISISESLLTDFHQDILWKFWNVRDVRTFTDYNKVKKLTNKKPHNALEDAVYQAQIIQSGLKKGE